MRKLILTITAFGLFYSSGVFAQSTEKIKQTQHSIQSDQEWERSDEQRWKGANNTWYKIEGDQVMKSKDGQNWEMIHGNTFQTQDGTMYRYYQGKLYKLEDGQIWRSTEEFTDPQGNTYTLDTEGNLMIRE